MCCATRYLNANPDDLRGLAALLGHASLNTVMIYTAPSKEELARQWIFQQALSDQLSFQPEAIGSFWNRNVQVDVVAINWQTHDILLGECKWGLERVDRQVARELIEEKTPWVLKDLPENGAGWKVQYALFGRSGFTPAAKAEMEKLAGMLVDLKTLDSQLGHA